MPTALRLGGPGADTLGLVQPQPKPQALFLEPINTALSALCKVDGALRRIGGKNDYIYYAGKRGIHQILKK